MQSEFEKQTRPSKPKRRSRPAGQLRTLAQTAEFLNVSQRTVYRLLDRGLPRLRVGYALRFDLDRVLEWLEVFTARGDQLRWQDDYDGLGARRAPTADLPPSRRSQALAPEFGRSPTADLPPSRRPAPVIWPAPKPADIPLDQVTSERRPDPERTKRRIGI